MGVEYAIAVIGSGPAGMSAAARAAKRGQPHILLERSSHLTSTVHGYQKRKHVMAAPRLLPVHSDIRFDAGTREEVLDHWNRDVAKARVNIRLKSEVAAVRGRRGAFAIELADGATITAAHVILATGTGGNPRKLAIPGADLPFVQYYLADADDHRGETIVVIGAGDSAIEDALALATRNEVVLVNRGTDFRKAKPANAAQIAAAIAGGRVRAILGGVPTRIEPGAVVLESDAGETRVACERVIARLGTMPPAAFLESCGLALAGDRFPALSETYESAVPGLYIIGALAGYPLIKYGLKQGYEAVEHILGNHPAPADEPILTERLRQANLNTTVAQFIAALRQRVALFAPVPVRQIREFLLHARIRRVRAGDVIVERNEYSDRLYWVLEGELALETSEPRRERTLCPVGDVMGTLEFVSGRRRTGAVTATRLSLLLEADRAAMTVLFRASPPLRQAIDKIAMTRQIKLQLAPGLDDAAVAELVRTARIDRFKAGEAIVHEGDADDPLHIVRRGSVTVSRSAGEREAMLAYLPAGSFIGESGWLAGRRPASVRATTATETIRLDGATVRQVLDAVPAVREQIAAAVADHLRERPADSRGDGLVRFLLDHGLGEATDVLLIDEARCVGCNNCETACAETHGGVSALDRQGGAQHGTLHLPNACRHCEHPHCMSECPTNSLHRTADGSVYIDDTCTGCGNCERNCPYGAIRMAGLPEKKPNLLARLLFGWGEAADEAVGRRPASKHAVKCDGCRGAEMPACVSACPTGAAFRVNPESFIAAQLKPQGRRDERAAE